MKKKLLALLSLLTVFTVSAFGAGCALLGGGTSSDSGSSSSSSIAPDSSSTPAPVVPTVTLSAATLSMEVYESATLTATLENSEETIVWTSSDETIAKVVDGVVTAYKVGTATITATAGNASATCEVTVSAGTETPVFSALPDTLNIIKGSNETLDATLTYKNNEFTMATVTYATEGDKISVSEDGVVTAVEYGTQNVAVKAFVGMEEVASKTVAVTVIEYGILLVDLPENTLNIKVGGEGYALSNIQVQINGVVVENPEFTAVSKDSAVADIEAGKIVAVDRGETTVKVSYVSESNTTYETTITVIVTKDVAESEFSFFVKGDSTDLSKVDTGNATIDLTEADLDPAQISQVLCNETEIAFTVEGNSITLTNAPAGEQVYTFVTPAKDYTFEGCIYNNIISTKEEFLNYRNNSGNIFAYSVLSANIDLEGEVLSVAPHNFMRGILDGRGHTVSNFTLSGVSLMQNIAATGGFKNIQFVNVVQDCSESAEQMKFGLFAQVMYGTLEDVLVYETIKNLGEKQYIGTAVYSATTGSTVKNLIMNITTDGTAAHWILGFSSQSGANIDGVYAVINATNVTVTNVEATNYAFYAKEEDLAYHVDFSTWAGWTEVAGKTPYLSDYSAIFNAVSVQAKGESEVGQTITFNSTSYYPLTYALKEEVSGVSLEGNVLTIGAEATVGATVVVVASCEAIPDYSEEFTFTVKKAVVDTGYEFLVQGSAGKWVANTGDATIDLSSTEINLSQVEKVLCNDAEVTFAVEGNSLKLTDAPGGDQTYILVTPNANYSIKGCVYGIAISTTADLLDWRTKPYSAYCVLLNDIDFEGATLPAITGYKVCTLDGRGYTISNFTYTTGFVANMNPGSSAIKNVQFLNVAQDCAGLEVIDGGGSGVNIINTGLFGNDMCGTLENIKVVGTIKNVASGVRHWGMLAYKVSGKVSHIVANITSDGTMYDYALATGGFSGNGSIDNVYMVFNNAGNGGLVTNKTATNTGMYATEADLLAAANFSSWGEPWKVEAGKLPYMGESVTE